MHQDDQAHTPARGPQETGLSSQTGHLSRGDKLSS